MKISSAGIITRHESPEVERVGRELRDWLNNRKVDAELDQIDPGMDILVILGGDGTLLHVANQASNFDIPVLGINWGNLGFLTEVAADEMYHTLETVLQGDIRIEKRMMLSTYLVNSLDGTRQGPEFSLNEVVIVKESLGRVIELRCWADREYITTYKADGLIISTPTGSTAYNLSAGGPIVHAELNTIGVTPICPFMLESRPVLLAPQARLSIQLATINGGGNVLVDGRQLWRVREKDVLMVERATKPLQIISSPSKSYFTILRNKLNWGGSKVDLPLAGVAAKYL